jgi:hypothetical protein
MKLGRFILVVLLCMVLFTAGVNILRWQWWAVAVLVALITEVK